MKKVVYIMILCFAISLVGCGMLEKRVSEPASTSSRAIAETSAKESTQLQSEETYNESELYPEIDTPDVNEPSISETTEIGETEYVEIAPTETALIEDVVLRTVEAVESIAPEELSEVMESDNGTTGVIFSPITEYRYKQYKEAAEKSNEWSPVQFNIEIVREYDYIWKEANREDEYICDAVNWYALCSDADIKTFTVSEVSATSIVIYYVLGDNTTVPLCQVSQMPGDEDTPLCIIYSLI